MSVLQPCPSFIAKMMDTFKNQSIKRPVHHVVKGMMDSLTDRLNHWFSVKISALSLVYLLFYKREKEEKKRVIEKEYARAMDNGHPAHA